MIQIPINNWTFIMAIKWIVFCGKGQQIVGILDFIG